MDFASWSPSHTVLVLFIILGFIGQVAILFYRTSRLEKHQDKTDERIDKQGETFFHAQQRFEDRIDKRLSGMQAETNQRLSDMQGEINQRLSDMQGEIRDVRLELSKLNQNHIDHLTQHDT